MSNPFNSGPSQNPFDNNAPQPPPQSPQQAPRQSVPPGVMPPASNPFATDSASEQTNDTQTPFGSGTTAHATDLSVAGPPMHILFIVIGLAVLGIAIAVLPWGFTGIIGWVIAGPVAILMLGNYTTTDVKRRASGMYASRPAASTLYWVAAIVTIIAVIVTALLTALWVGRL